jgi:hypothetical protein
MGVDMAGYSGKGKDAENTEDSRSLREING